MSNPEAFSIRSGVLLKYQGPGGDVTIPDNVSRIGKGAFRDCNNLTSITIPEGVDSIGEGAFAGCKGLADANGFVIIRESLYGYYGPGGDVTIPIGVTSISDQAFWLCNSLTSVIIPETVTNIGEEAFWSCNSLASVTIPDSVTSIGKRAFEGCRSLTSVIIPVGVTSIGFGTFQWCESLTSVLIPRGVTNIGGAAFAFCSKLTSMTIPMGVTNIDAAAFASCSSLKSVTIPDSVTNIGDRAFFECKSLKSVTIPAGANSIGEDAFKGCKKLKKVTIPAGRDISWLVDLDPAGQLCGAFPDLNKFCRDADEAQMTAMITKAKKWPSKWKKLFFASYLHSDTRAAMLLADKRGEFAQYAELRGADEDELRDRMLSDLGLDKHGSKVYDLGGSAVTARLLPDFRFSMELADGTPVKSLPKKGADPEKYKEAKSDLAQMKKDVVKIWKNRADILLGDFLSGRERTAEYWTRTYDGNPILHGVACLLVWEQDGVCFTRTDAGTIRADGTPYVVTDKPIRLAHPMKLSAVETEAWQRYFISHGLKQPFEQIWEPVEAADTVRAGRYDGCTVPLYALMNKEKHGIMMEGRSKLILRDCSAELGYLEGHHDWINNEYEVKNFRFEKYTRQVNHIVVLLDKATVADRVKKDDASVAHWFDRFTLAQITEFIAIAQESGAVNVLALLLEYKNEHFAGFDPMEEFTLEW